MITDEERLEVADRLRSLSEKRETQGFDCLLAEAVRGYDFCETPCDECHRRLAAELVDLIEPAKTCEWWSGGDCFSFEPLPTCRS